MNKSDMPASIRRFIDEQDTCPVSGLTKIRKSDLRSPFSGYWYRAIACMMLSGRVRPRSYQDGSPNMTDVNRIGKEANFNQYLFERCALTLATLDVVVEGRYGEGPYQEGPNIETFWNHDEKKLPEIGRQGVLKYIEEHAGYLPKRATPLEKAHLIEFVTLFFAVFEGRAVKDEKVTTVLRDFGRLPKEDLVQLAKELGLKPATVQPDAWSFWLELKDGEVLARALSTAEWMYGEERGREVWVYPGDVGLWMLGLGEPLPPYKLPETLKAGAGQTIQAGAGLGRQTLVPLFRHGKIKKIGEVCDVQLDSKRMAQAPAGTSPGEELRQALKDLDPLPPAIAKLLGTESQLGGELVIIGCNALVKPENDQMLDAIRRHPSLKNYVEPGGPPGYLLIKPASEPYNFIERCQKLGFKVTMQGAMPLDRRKTWGPARGKW